MRSDSSTATAGRNRRSPTGGRAYGIPRKASTGVLSLFCTVTPTTVPCLIMTCGLARTSSCSGNGIHGDIADCNCSMKCLFFTWIPRKVITGKIARINNLWNEYIVDGRKWQEYRVCPSQLILVAIPHLAVILCQCPPQRNLSGCYLCLILVWLERIDTASWQYTTVVE